MRTLLSILGIAAALVMCGVSGAMNYLFMASIGKTPLEGEVLGVASAAADVLKALLPFFIAWSWAARRMVAAVSGTLAFIFFAGFSLLSAVGFAADNRGALIEGREGVSQTYRRMRVSITEAESRLAALPAHRPASVVSADIHQQRQSRRWSTTKECTEATEAQSRDYCAEYFRLRGEVAAASEADGLRTSIAALQGEADALRRGGAGQDSDPQVTLLSRILGQEPDNVRLALMIAIAVLVEIGASLGLFLASGHHPVKSVQKDDVKRIPAHEMLSVRSIEDFCLQALIPVPQNVLDRATLEGAYREWCAESAVKVLDCAEFYAGFEKLAEAIELERAGGGFVGIGLTHARSDPARR